MACRDAKNGPGVCCRLASGLCHWELCELQRVKFSEHEFVCDGRDALCSTHRVLEQMRWDVSALNTAAPHRQRGYRPHLCHLFSRIGGQTGLCILLEIAKIWALQLLTQQAWVGPQNLHCSKLPRCFSCRTLKITL